MKLIKQAVMSMAFFVTLILFSAISVAEAVSFNSVGLNNESINNPTSLDFGPDGRLYVSQQDGAIWAFTVARDNAQPGQGSYTVTSAELIDVVQVNTPNHTDDGIPTTIKLRQVTGIHTAGTASNPILYVTSSDNLIGGGGGINDKNLDTNSGVISKLTWNGNTWAKVDLVRGLPRCEENHSINGMDIFEKNNQTFMLVQQGGHSNKGAPSNNFVGTPEYFLSGSLLLVNLTQLESMPVYTDPRSGTQYVYDLPTLNDPNREDITNDDARFPYPSGHPLYNATIDVGDPFGGDDGLNQAFAEAGGPVQIFSPGYRNAYDVIVTEDGKVYTYDNGPNTGWGGLPLIYNSNDVLKGDQSTTSYNPNAGDYVKNEFNEVGSGGHGDTLHYVGTIDDDLGTYYGGHPIPILAFPSRADLITYKNISGEWVETSRFSLASTLPGVSGYFNSSFSIADFPDDPRVGEYLADALDSDKVNILDIINSSTNGITEYTASTFSGALKGNIFAASFNGNITRYALNPAGDAYVTKETIFSGFGAIPLDVIALPDGHPFAGTIWAATYGADNITVFEPQELTCPGSDGTEFDPDADSDGDGYSNQDELDNGTSFCSGGSTPSDNDQDFVSDLNDNDDDNDTIPDVEDAFAIDPNNGTTTNLPLKLPFWNNDPGTGFFGLGFTGLMLDPTGNTDYLTQYDEDNISFGGAAGKASIDLIPAGDPIGNNNSQQYGFQVGINVDNSSPTFTVHTRIESPFFGIGGVSTTPVAYQSVGLAIGNGDQDNYLKVVLGYGTSTSDDVDGVEVLLEQNGSSSGSRYDVPGLLDGNAVDIYINISPADNTAQSYVSTDAGVTLTALGNPIALPASFLDGSDDKGMAVGLISTSFGSGATPFSAIWDFINVNEDQSGVVESSVGDGALDFGELTLGGNAAQINIDLQNLSGPGDPALSIFDLDIVGADSALFSSLLNLPVNLGSGGEITIPLTFTPAGSAGLKTATLQIAHSGEDSPLTIPLTAFIEQEGQQQAILRINAGGSQISASDDGPNWLADTNTSSSSSFSVNTGITAIGDLDFADKDGSIPDYIDSATYESLFSSERWDPGSGPEMSYSIPLNNGNYLVNLYVGNDYDGTQTVGSRIYDISLEGQTVVNDLDLIESFGHKVGGMLSLSVEVNDGELNIDFDHEVENPLINGIEIFAESGGPGLSLQPISDRSSAVSNNIDFAVIASGGDPSSNYAYSISGQPAGVEIEPTNGQVFGTISASAANGGPNQNGIHTVSVTVSQSGFGSVTQQFQWTVNDLSLFWIDKDESEDYTGRHECSFVQAGDTFIMFGGREASEQLDVYDYSTNTWSQGGTAPFEFNHFQAINYQGLVWVIGAFKDNSFPNEAPVEHIYTYNPATQQWIQGIEIPESRRRGSTGLVIHDDKFYVVGGNVIGHNGGYVAWFDVYDPATGEWTVLQDAPRARDHFHATIFDDKLYAIGGRLSGGDGGVFLPLIQEVDVYDFATGSWSTLSSSQNLPTGRAGASVANFNNNILIMGGEGATPGPAFDVVEIFDPVTGIWKDGPSMNHPRHGTQALVSGNGVYIAGGSPNRGGGNQTNMEVLGEDEPVGQASVASLLSADQDDIEFTYELADGNVVLDFNLSSAGGNTANYIQSVTVSGANFTLAENYNHRLLAPQSELQIQVVLTNTTPLVSEGVVTVNFDGAQSIEVSLSGSRDSNETVVYRVNAGSNGLSDTPIAWASDVAANPSPFVNANIQNKTYTNAPSNFVNNTAYDASLFESTRWSSNASVGLQWDFPVDNGDYIVNLLFAEVWSGASSPGVRVFDVQIENAVVLDDFDITASYGFITAGVESFAVSVNDGNLDINLIKNIQNPSINGIEIIKID